MNLKNKKIKRLFQQIPFLGMLLVVVSSCSTSQQLAGEADGIYFNPATDQRVVAVSYEDTEYDDGNIVRIGGKYFDENGNAPVIEKQKNYYSDYKNGRKSHYAPWGDEDNQTNVSINYMVSPFYNSFGFGFNYGYGSGWYDPFFYGGYNPYYYGMNSGYYWNRPFYNPYYSWNDPFYSPYYSYNPYYGYYGGYNPYYYAPYYSPYYGGGYYNRYYGTSYNPIPYKKSGADAIYRGNNGYYRNNNRQSVNRNSYSRRSTFRSDSGRRNYNYQNNNNYNRSSRNTYSNDSNSGYRGSWIDRSPSTTPMRSSSSGRSSGGFRTGAFR